ncbi:MAG TPA: HAD-IIIA family hydrolase [Patescibacteria group bacterium]
MEKAIFINKERMITQEARYTDYSETTLLPGAAESLTLLKNAGFKLILTANQAPRRMDIFEISRQLQKFNTDIDGFYYCPHTGAECECHKPKAGLLFEAAEKENLDLKNSWLIGDTLDDIEAGNRAGCNTILLANGNETQWHVTPIRQPEFLSPNFEYAAGAVILKSIYQMIKQQQSG